jgi:hypothetical protein
MNIKRFIIFFATILAISAFPQEVTFRFPSEELKKFSEEALLRVGSNDTVGNHDVFRGRITPSASQIFKYRENRPVVRNFEAGMRNTFTGSDTLYIGDTLEITGEWLRNGPIVIYNSGLLHFYGAHATIIGDIYLFGDHAQLLAESSTLYIPQEYFYQRMVFATGGSKVTYRNTTVDHSSLSHNILLVDSARLELIDVTNIGFTTNGIYDRSSVYVNGINEAGEYIVMDESSLEFYHANTLLLWHQFPEEAVIDFSFPGGDTVYNYRFNNTIPGVNNINYSIVADSCMNVMWGLMPTTGSDITISDSELRAIGLWFMGSDTVNVSGLVDNSDYADFEAPLNDRTLRLINCSVTTWSIYPMEHSFVNLGSSIIGEAGTGGRSTIFGDRFFCDGSGGYLWSSDSSFLLAGFSYTSGYVRSQANSMLYYAYSSLSGGFPSALQNSVIMVIQCIVPEEPRAYDNGVAWYAIVNGPSQAFAGEIVPITGSAWIDKTATSNMMDFGSYRLYYQLNGSSSWTEIPSDSLQEKRNETLGFWNTAGLPAGQYIIKLLISDNWGNPAEAVKSVMLQPSFGISETLRNSLRIYPNPAHDRITVQLPAGMGSLVVRISDITGRICLEQVVAANPVDTEIQINTASLKPGLYVVNVASGFAGYHSIIAIR